MTYRIEGFADACKIHDGCDAESERYTLAEAKACARYFLTDAHRRGCEAEECLNRALVYNERNECVYDTTRLSNADVLATGIDRFFSRPKVQR